MFNVLITDRRAEIIYWLSGVEGVNDKGHILLAEYSFLIFTVYLFLRSQLGGIHQNHFAVLILLIQKEYGDIGTGVSKYVRRHRNHAPEHTLTH